MRYSKLTFPPAGVFFDAAVTHFQPFFRMFRGSSQLPFSGPTDLAIGCRSEDRGAHRPVAAIPAGTGPGRRCRGHRRQRGSGWQGQIGNRSGPTQSAATNRRNARPKDQRDSHRANADPAPGPDGPRGATGSHTRQPPTSPQFPCAHRGDCSLNATRTTVASLSARPPGPSALETSLRKTQLRPRSQLFY